MTRMLRGSARSMPGIHIRDVLDAIAARDPLLIQKFGGHAMAAGVTLEASAARSVRAPPSMPSAAPALARRARRT